MGRAGIMLPPSLPTIKETTLSWLGSELESSLFSTNEKNIHDSDAANQISSANIQRYIDFDDQCLSLKSGEGSTSDFSGIQPLPAGSDDTPPMCINEFNRVVKMDFKSLLSEHDNRPKPEIESDDDDDAVEQNIIETDCDALGEYVEHQNNSAECSTQPNFENLVEMLDDKMAAADIGALIEGGDDPAVEKLQLIRLWQLMQQEELRRRQEAELAMLNAQRERMKIDRKSQNLGLEKVDTEEILTYEEQDLKSLEKEGMISETEDPNNSAIECSNNSHNSINHDEVPVDGKKKSFEQLLEDELKKDQSKKKSESQENVKGPIKRPFLKKGQGLARFKGPPSRKLTKATLQNVPKSTSQNTEPKLGKLPEKKTEKGSILDKKSPISVESVPWIQKSHGQIKNSVDLTDISKNNSRLKHKISKPDEKITTEPQHLLPVEDVDLEEFEMLERYAEDDASFFNEPSLIVSVLQQEDDVNNAVKPESQLSLRERVRERRRLREEARAKIQDVTKFNQLNVANKSCMQLPSKSQEYAEQSDVFHSLSPPQSCFKSLEHGKIKMVHRKTASLVKKEKLVYPVAQAGFLPPCASSNVPPHENFNQICSSPHSAFSPHQNAIITSDPQNAKSSFENILLKHDDQGDEFQDEQTWGDIDNSALYTSLPPSNVPENCVEICKTSDDSPKLYKVADYMVPENEDIENPVRDTDTVIPTNALSLSPPPPPTSLMQKLFPGLKPPKSTSIHKDAQDHSVLQRQIVSQTTSADVDANVQESSQASVLKQKLLELESEIVKFKKENIALENLRKNHEENLKSLEKEMVEFNNQKEEELARLEEYKKTEIKKLKKERKLFEEHVLATRMAPRKEEREEILQLKEAMECLRSDNKVKEQRWISSNNRMRNQVERLEAENKQLQQRIDEMENQRLKEWNVTKTNQPKPQSIWKTVNKIVESSILHAETENGDQTNIIPLKSSNLSTGNSSSGSVSTKQRRKEKCRIDNMEKSKSISPESAYSILKDTIEQSSKNSNETVHKDGKVEKTLKDGSKVVVFPNGTQKEISSDGKTVKVRFANGDIKQIYGDGSIVYYYEENGTTHTTHHDGLQVFEFPNKQVEHHFPDGTKQITFPDQTVKYLHTDGTEQTVFSDGTEMHIATNKDKTIVFANGQREIHTNDFKRREYPDGTSKTVFGDGRQETRYSSGRLRVKDAHGNVIVDRINV